ncbi:MAG: efflux RND transporter permease subunit [Planctomycetes bacterium]|nr:efflux RND transporter permease subunit [Planctomycetota bacterium]
MSLPDIAIKNPVFSWMIMLFLILFGGYSFTRLGVSQMPDVDFPNVSISVALEGASPEVMETDVVDVIEDAVMSVQGIREVTSTARHGTASVSVEFELSRDIDAAVQDIQTKLAQSTRLLPREIDPPVVTKTNPEDQPILWMALSGQKPLQELTLFARDHVKDKFQTVAGVGEVMMGGYLDRNMRVWLHLEEMEARQIAVDDVISALQREHVEVPAGRIETASREMSVRSVGEAPSVAEFRKIVVAYRNDAAILLGDIALVEDGLADRRRMARTLGLPAVGLGIKKQRGANAVAVAQAVKARMEEIRKTLPPGYDLGVNFDSTRFIEDSIGEIQFTMVLSVILTSLVCWLFLGSWTSTLNILLAIPTSIVGSFLIIYFLGFTLNTFTLLGLSLAVGIVVDDAIMVLENIVRHREKGEERLPAASRGAREITLAAIAATLSIIAIFLPIAFMEGIIGKFLYQFGVTISVAVALSLLEALTLTPMRCSQILQVGERATRLGRFLDAAFKSLAAAYRAVLGPALRWRAGVLLLATGIFAGSLWLARGINQEIVPAQDQSMFMVRFQTPVGSSIDYTDARLRDCEAIVSSRPETARYFGVVGGFGGGEVDTGIMFITLKPPEERGPTPVTQLDMMNFVRTKFNSVPGLKAYVSDLSMRGLTSRGSNFPIQVAVTGPDWRELADRADQMMDRMRDSGLMIDVNSDYLVGMPELRIVPDRDRAADLGVSVLSIGQTVNALVGGVRVTKFKDAGHRYDVRLRLVSNERSQPEDVKRLFVRNRDGGLVRLSEVVQIHEEPVVQTITRRNRARAITISANMVPGKSQKDALERVQAIAAELLPPGYGIEFTGSSVMFLQSAFAFLFAIGSGVLIAYMVLASQFNSFVHPLLVLLAMPFSLTGAVLAMMLAGVTFNMYSMIGIVLLMGIVKKNSILLVEFTNRMREHGLAPREALLEACPIRLRPILMTSISTIAAAVPPALALGPGAETRIPMAVVVIGGVLVSTFLTLFVVPCAYAVLPGRVAREEEAAVSAD